MPEIVSGNSQNVATPKQVDTRSKFQLPYNFFNTYRFGYIAPHFWKDDVPSDKNDILHCAHDARTYTLKSPLMQDVKMRKEYFQIYMDAILPFNWDKIYTNPSIGDDVNASLVGCTVQNFPGQLYNLFNGLLSLWSGSTTTEDKFKTAFYYLILGELFFSNGCLLTHLGVHLNRLFLFQLNSTSQLQRNQRFDDYFDTCITYITTNVKRAVVVVDGNSYTIDIDGSIQGFDSIIGTLISLRHFIELIRQDLPTLVVTSVTLKNPGADDFLLSQDGTPTVFGSGTGQFPLNLNKLFAYQLVCSHYFTNDKVDYVYSAELYREYIHSLILINGITDATFTYNGLSIPYDYCSAYYFGQILANSNNWGNEAAYLIAIFQFRNSLRFVDYFTGSRTRPLAIGNVNVNITGMQFSVIDMVQRTQASRFLNAVNRFNRQMSEYIKGLFPDATSHPDYHVPIWIGSTEDIVHSVETENTGTDQLTKPNSVTSLLRSNANRYAFEIASVDRPCIILGLTYFDVSRAYFRSIERQNFHVDRYDMFNPFMQFIGDQMVYGAELNNALVFNNSASCVGYQLRHSEYKQRFHQAAGGFCDSLPGYAFLNDYDEYEDFGVNGSVVTRQSPEFIRSHSWELDRFFVSLTGWSYGHYFHFIIVNYNDNESSRPMAYAPSIL